MNASRQQRGLRVLVFADVRESLVAACRVHAPLTALAAAGLVADYVVTDGTLRGAPRDGFYDLVWLQRGADDWLAATIAERLRGRFLLDVDDHLLCRPSYVSTPDLPDHSTFVAALAACRVLTTPSARLRGLLEARSGLELEARWSACPNAVPFEGHGLRMASRPAAILLTQGHRLALTTSRAEVLTAIAEAAARHDLPLWSLGPLPEGLRAAATSAGASLSPLSRRTWSQYHDDLSGGPTLLGVAPLETRGDPATVEFVSGKSDVKLVEYGGFGHPAVYSRAAPYEDSDLRCGRLATNDHAGWTTAIDEIMGGGWRAARDEAQVVRSRRDLTRVAAEHWWPALQAARLQEPVAASKLLGEVDRARACVRDRIARVRWRLRQSRRAPA